MLALGWSVAALAIAQASLGLSSAVSLSSQSKSLDKRAGKEFVNLAYFYYQSNPYPLGRYTPKDLPVEDLTHVAYAFANPDETGTVKAGDLGVDIGSQDENGAKDAHGYVEEFYRLKKENRGLKVSLAIGGWMDDAQGKAFANLMTNPVTRKRFVTSAVKRMVDYGFDGIDVDWEFPRDNAQVEAFVTLLKDLRAELTSYSKESGCKFELTAATAGSHWNYRHLIGQVPMGRNFLPEINALVDRLHVMTYDYAAGITTTEHNANLHPPTPLSAGAAVAIEAYSTHGASPEKLVLGMPLYGRVIHGTTGEPGYRFVKEYDIQANAAEGIPEANTYLYSALPAEGPQVIFNETLGAAYSYDPVKRQFISYDTPKSVAFKTEWAKAKNLGGSFFWQATGDKKGEQSLLKTSRKVLWNLDSSQNCLKYPSSRFETIRNNLEDAPVSPSSSSSSSVPVSSSSSFVLMPPVSSSSSSSPVPFNSMSKPARNLTTNLAMPTSTAAAPVTSQPATSKVTSKPLTSVAATSKVTSKPATSMAAASKATSKPLTSVAATSKVTSRPATSHVTSNATTSLFKPKTLTSANAHPSASIESWNNSTMTSKPSTSETTPEDAAADDVAAPADPMVTAAPTPFSPEGKELRTHTVYSTIVSTISKCPVWVVDCPVGAATTETVPIATETQLLQPQATALTGVVINVRIVNLQVIVVCSRGGRCKCPMGLLCHVEESNSNVTVSDFPFISKTGAEAAPAAIGPNGKAKSPNANCDGDVESPFNGGSNVESPFNGGSNVKSPFNAVANSDDASSPKTGDMAGPQGPTGDDDDDFTGHVAGPDSGSRPTPGHAPNTGSKDAPQSGFRIVMHGSDGKVQSLSNSKSSNETAPESVHKNAPLWEQDESSSPASPGSKPKCNGATPKTGSTAASYSTPEESSQDKGLVQGQEPAQGQGSMPYKVSSPYDDKVLSSPYDNKVSSPYDDDEQGSAAQYDDEAALQHSSDSSDSAFQAKARERITVLKTIRMKLAKAQKAASSSSPEPQDNNAPSSRVADSSLLISGASQHKVGALLMAVLGAMLVAV